jgi:Fibronectin type III domain
MRLQNIFLFILFPLWGLGSYAQVFPVQMTPVFNSPYSSKISDYATSLDTKFQLIVNPTDIGISNRQVRFKIYIQGNGITAQSSDFVTGLNPIFINGGDLITLTNVDLAALFRLENLQGITASEYANPLPEGIYSFCFELYDYVTNQRISQKSCANIYLMLNDPPLLNLPARNEQIAVTDFPNILFTWTPRQLNATNVSYKFELKEIQDPSIDPQFGFAMSRLLHEETLFGTALNYDLGKPNLIAGKRYAWRVKAISTSGLSENAVFKNEGYSEIFWFTYASQCVAPTFVLSEILSTKSVKITWQGNIDNTKYHVQYRKKNVASAEWFSVYTLNQQTTISDLEASVDYEFRVGATCEPAGVATSYIYSGINSFSMPAEGTTNTAFSCGINPAVAITNRTPITNLIVSETFTAGDFPVKILELQGNNPYSGRGYIVVPYLADTKIAVQFNNITVNTAYQLINGVVETTYNPDWVNVIDINPLVVDVFGPQTGTTGTGTTGIDSQNNAGGNTTGNSGDTNSNSGNTTSGNTNTGGNTNNNNNPDTGNNTTGNTNTSGNNTDSNNNNSNNSTGTNVTGNDYYIEYKGQKYYKGGKIKIPFKRNMFETFEMKTLSSDARVGYTIHEPGKQEMWRGYDGYTSKTTIPIEENTGNLVNLRILDLQSEATSVEGKPKVRVEIEKVVKPFTFSKLQAIDISNKNRVADAGEILYYINKPTVSTDAKNTEFKITNTPNIPIEEIPKENIKWKLNNTDYTEGTGILSFSKYVNEKKDVKVTGITGFPNSSSKSVNVKWVDEKKQFTSFASKISGLLKVLELINTVSEKVEKVAPCKAVFLKDFNNSLVWKKENFNQEDNDSRHILDIKRFEFQLKASDLALLECSKKMGVSAFGYEINLGEIYVKVGVGSEITIRNDKIFYHENEKFLKDRNTSSGGLTVKGELGLRGNIGTTETDANGTQWGIKYGANTSITGGGKIEYPYKGDNNVMGAILYINPLIYTLKASVKMGPLDKEFEYSDILWNLKLEKTVPINLN